jgi:hypothetical protein
VAKVADADVMIVATDVIKAETADAATAITNQPSKP